MHHEVAESEDGGGESNPWDRNLFYNLNLQQVHIGQDAEDEFLDEEDIERFLESRRIVAVLAYL